MVKHATTLLAALAASGCGATMADVAKPIQQASTAYVRVLDGYERLCEPTPAVGAEKLCPELRAFVQASGEATNHVIDAYSTLNEFYKQLEE